MRFLAPFFLLHACGVDDAGITASVDPNVSTVVHVEWTSHTPGRGWVEYGPDDAYGYVTPIDDVGTDHAATLLGIPAESTWHYRVVEQANGVPVEGADHTVTTGELPGEIPELLVRWEGEDTLAQDYTLFSWWNVVSDDSFAAIVNRDGDIVWYWTADDGYITTVRMSEDKTAIIALVADTGQDPEARIVRVPLDGGDPIVTATPMAHHDFLETDGGYTYIAGNHQVVDGHEYIGDAIMEVDLDGNATVVWDAFERLERIENEGWGQDPIDWTHVNGIAYDPQDDAYLLSFFWYRTVLKIDRATGDQIWALGGDWSDFTFVDDPGFGPQHCPEWVDGGILLFDNASENGSSRVVEYKLDPLAGTATPTWQWAQPEGTYTRLLGDVDLVRGGAITGWGELETVVSLNENGEASRTLAIDSDGMMGQVEQLTDLYPADATFPR